MAMTIGKRIVLGFSAVVLLTAGLGTFAYTRMVAVDHDAKAITGDAMPGTIAINKVDALTRTNMALTLQRIVYTDPQECQRIDAEIAANVRAVDETLKTYEGTITRDEDRKLFGDLKAGLPALRAAQAHVLGLAAQDKDAEATETYKKELAPAYATFTAALKPTVDFNINSANEFGQEISAAIASGKTWMIIGVVSAMILGAGIAMVIIRGINKVLSRVARTLGEGSEQVASASRQVSGASQSLARGATEQAASLEETSSSLEEMSSMTKRNAETATQAATLTEEAKRVADRGNVAMDSMTAAINDIQKSATETARPSKPPVPARPARDSRSSPRKFETSPCVLPMQLKTPPG
jgi:methyl-accepting chemotaxis protein